MSINSSVCNFFQDEAGVAAVEYALVVALVAVVCVASITNVGIQVNITFSKVASALTSASNSK